MLPAHGSKSAKARLQNKISMKTTEHFARSNLSSRHLNPFAPYRHSQTVGNPGPTFDFRHAKRDLGITSSPRNLVPETAQSIPEAQDLSIGGRPEPLRTYKLRTPSKTLRAVQLEEPMLFDWLKREVLREDNLVGLKNVPVVGDDSESVPDAHTNARRELEPFPAECLESYNTTPTASQALLEAIIPPLNFFPVNRQQEVSSAPIPIRDAESAEVDNVGSEISIINSENFFELANEAFFFEDRDAYSDVSFEIPTDPWSVIAHNMGLTIGPTDTSTSYLPCYPENEDPFEECERAGADFRLDTISDAFAALAPMIQSPPSPSYTSIFGKEPVIPQHSRSSSPLPPGPSDMVVSPDDGREWSVSESRELDEGLETPSNSSATSATLKSDAQSLAASYRIVPQEEPLQGQQGQKFYTAAFTPVSALANLSLPSAAPLDTRTLDEDIACMLDSFNANDDSHVTHVVDPIVSDILDACEGDGLNLDDILDGYSVCPPSTETQPALQARQSRVSPPSQSPSHPKADDMQADEQDLNSCPKWSPRMPPDSPRPTGILEPVSPVDHMDGTLLAVNIPETANRSPSPAPSGEMVMLSRALSPPQDQPSLVHSDGRLLGPSLFPDDVSDEDL